MIEEEARRKAEAKVASLEVERISLMLEVRETKDEVSCLQSHTGKDKAFMEKDYQKALELIFAYGYRCCMFKHNTCGGQPEVPKGMPDSSNPLPPEFFVNPKGPSVPTPIEAIKTEVDQSEAARRAEELERSAPTGDFDGTS